MMRRIKRFGVFQTAKVIGLMYFLTFLIIFLPFGLVMMAIGGLDNSMAPFPAAMGGIFIFLMPVVYGFFAFLITLISLALYNLVSSWVGGIEVEFDAKKDEASSSQILDQ